MKLKGSASLFWSRAFFIFWFPGFELPGVRHVQDLVVTDNPRMNLKLIDAGWEIAEGNRIGW
jgi:hypothetical protein